MKQDLASAKEQGDVEEAKYQALDSLDHDPDFNTLDEMLKRLGTADFLRLLADVMED